MEVGFGEQGPVQAGESAYRPEFSLPHRHAPLAFTAALAEPRSGDSCLPPSTAGARRKGECGDPGRPQALRCRNSRLKI